MYIRLIIGILIIVTTTFCGYLLSLKYYNRYEFFKNFLAFNNEFMENVSFKRIPINDILKEKKGDFFEELLKLRNDDISKLNINYLTNEDKLLFKEYSNSIGKSDVKGEIDKIKFYDLKISSKLKIYEEEYKRNKTLYIKFSFLIGLIILIIIL